MISAVLRPLRQWKMRSQAFLSLARSTRRRALGAKVFKPLKQLSARLRRRVLTGQIRLVQILAGPKAANRFFWRSPTGPRVWFDVENRIFQLAEHHPQTIAAFTRLAFDHALDPTTTIGLARNVWTAPHLAAAISQAALADGTPFAERLRQSRDYSAAILGAVGLLLDDAAAQAIGARIEEIHPSVGDRFFALLDSFSLRPAMPPKDNLYRCIRSSGMRSAGKKRLIITEDFSDKRALTQLFSNTETVVLIGLNDTFGKADFSEYAATADAPEIVVEHIRTRISRFSEGYISAHAATRQAAATISHRFAQESDLLTEDLAPYLELAIADHLFFQKLKVEALNELISSDEFDHIVIACRNQEPTGSFYQILNVVDALKTDPRVELISVSRSLLSRTKVHGVLSTILRQPSATPSLFPWAPPTRRILIDLDFRVDAISSRFLSFAEDEKARVLLLTSSNTAYNISSARYAASLANDYSVRIGHVGGNAGQFHTALMDFREGADDIGIQFLPVQYPDGFSMLGNYSRKLILDSIDSISDTVTAQLVRVFLDRISNTVVQPSLVFFRLADRWFERLIEAKAAPDIVLLSPNRLPQVAVFAAIARKHGIPSLALEAHGLDANYSRYIKVTTDYYGVISRYFQEKASAGFEISKERTKIIGSPRIIAPQGHDILAARVAAREFLAEDLGADFNKFKLHVTFFCQPSGWRHVSQVWRNVLRATSDLDVCLFLKPHPEETSTRVSGYLEIANGLGFGDRVMVLQTDPSTAISASDIVLTAYSAAAIDAAVLGVPVFCVTEGDVDYPIAQHDIIGAPLLRSESELRAAFLNFIADPESVVQSAQKFLENEPQFITGPDDNLRAVVREILNTPSEDSLRKADTMPASLFTEGPHPIFPV